MRLNGQIGGTGQRSVGSQRGDHVVRVADMDIHRGDLVVYRHALDKHRATDRGVPCPLPRQADFSQPHRLLAVVGDEHRARGQDTRRAALRQGLQIGVDHRMLDLGQRQVGRLRRPRLRARQHQPVARRAGPPGAFHGEGRLPDAIHQAGIGRIQSVTAE